MSRASALILILLALSCGATRGVRGDDLASGRATLYAQYSAACEREAARCDEQQLVDAAREIRAWLPKREPDKLTLFVLESSAASSEAPDAPPPEWRQRWQALRNKQADALLALARRALKEHQPSIAYELVTEAVRENPDHREARKILGYVRFRDAWHTPFEIRQLNGGKVDHPRFGWLPKSHVERYEQGQRYYQGRWMPAAEEATLRADIKRGWRVESEHYALTTDHSLEEGVALARRLEALYRVWQQVFVGYTTSQSELARRFEGRPQRRDTKPHNVVYFRTRDEYNTALRGQQPRIDISLGIYFDKNRTAYFFAGADQEPGTIYHEASHQLFQETRPVATNVARGGNFWILEGIACYMETLEAHEPGYFTLGGMNAGRMPGARHRLLDENFYVPLATLVEMDMSRLQADPRIAEIYGQSSALADFFMHAFDGRYRDALVRYLEAIYTGRATVQTLADETGVAYDALDRQFREFMAPRRTAGEATSAAAH